MKRASITAMIMFAIGCAARIPPQALPAPAAAEHTIRDGVYTEAQSRRGESCHETGP